MRDADKILERGVVRVSAGQARALAVAAVVLVALAFVAGFQAGRVAGAVTAARAEAPGVVPDAGEDVADAVERWRSPPAGLDGGSGRGGIAAALAAETNSPPAPPPPAPVVEAPPPPRPPPEAPPPPQAPSEATVTPHLPPRAAPPGSWEVQLASYPDPAQADAAIADLARKGVAAVRREATVSGALWYRVRVGPFSSQEEARRRSLEVRPVSPYPPIVTRGD